LRTTTPGTGKRPRSAELSQLIAEEERRGITKPQVYRDWFEAIEKAKRAALSYLDKAIAEGKLVAAYGASTTTTTLLYHFELESRVKFIVDDNPLKHGRFSPGAHIPVLPSSELATRKPDVVVVLAWIYADPILKRNQAYLEAGGRFLLPLPEPRIVDKAGATAL